MRLDDLQALLQVVNHGSVQRAAVALRVSRSQLRRQIDRLEGHIATPLLRRSVTGVELTLAGKSVVEKAVPLLRDANALVDEARSIEGKAQGTLRVVMPLGFYSPARVQALLFLRAQNPGLAVDVVETEDPLTLIGEPFDLMLHFGKAPDRAGWFSRVVLRVPVSLSASAAYLDDHGTPTSLDDLQDHGLLLWCAPGLTGHGVPLKKGGAFEVKPAVTSSNLTLLVGLAEANGGIVCCAQLPGALESGPDLLPVLPGDVGTKLELRALSPKPSRADPKIRAFLENLQRLIAGIAVDK